MGYLISGNLTCLGGKISPALLDLQHLEYLDLGENDFQGLATPTFLGSLEKLQYLNLTHSSLVSNATTLETLDIAISNIEGSISNVEWGKLCNLQDLYLTQNKLNGDISRISGTIPTSIEQLSRLEILDLGQSQLKGALPESIFNLTELTQLFLATNDWEGNLSQNDFARLHQLKFLAISCGERFSVNLSSEWIPPFSLTYIEIRKCAFGSKLPTWLKTQKQLHTNILSNDSISDPIPPWLWTMCSQLQFLDLSDNEIGGNLPRLVNFPSSQSRTVDFYSSYSDGVVVDLSSNSFHGLIPINIGHVMTKLQVLDLSGNTFTGSIPYSITRVKQLMRLDLSDNHLSGKIPDWWADLQQLHVIDLSGNNLSGGIPPSLCSPPSLFWLRLSRNNLFGELPKSLSNCKSLLTLDIGENKISGTIPEWFGESL
ncbi:leucine-rich repeat receptor-like protein kinase PXC2 [Solanum tuberosum]|uniref:leucine-rich repeat receptor-like protein kinase PXC2 n=1 Tax=Solanum tuberosum TaxID=4113 RepID=UPI00073A1642|nr:PREDICTED: leucine-rich repeat receptor-like protein kinase PXC2 [Solanum tuberosum]